MNFWGKDVKSIRRPCWTFKLYKKEREKKNTSWGVQSPPEIEQSIGYNSNKTYLWKSSSDIDRVKRKKGSSSSVSFTRRSWPKQKHEKIRQREHTSACITRIFVFPEENGTSASEISNSDAHNHVLLLLSIYYLRVLQSREELRNDLKHLNNGVIKRLKICEHSVYTYKERISNNDFWSRALIPKISISKYSS